MDNGQCVSLSHLHAVHAHSDSIHLCIRGILGKSSLWLAGYDCLGCQTPKNDDKSPLACNRWSIRCCLIFASRKELHTIMCNNGKRNEVIYVHTQLLLVWRKSHCFQTPCLPLASQGGWFNFDVTFLKSWLVISPASSIGPRSKEPLSKAKRWGSKLPSLLSTNTSRLNKHVIEPILFIPSNTSACWSKFLYPGTAVIRE